MKIALINENSQASKNTIIYKELKNVANIHGDTVYNYGMESTEENNLTYVQAGLLAAILINSKAADFVVTGTETKATVAVTDISVDAKDATKVTLTLAAKLTDAKEYGVALDGITKTFVASDGKVDSISVDPVQIPYAEATEIEKHGKYGRP